MTSVTGVVSENRDGERASADPFAGSRIELSDRELRRVSPTAWFAGVKQRLDAVVTRLTYGR